jgi:hypothetical protein
MRPPAKAQPATDVASQPLLDASVPVNPLYSLKPGALWAQFKKEGFAFWMICGYIIVEYVRPQAIFPQLDILPWGLLVLVFALIARVLETRSAWVADATNWLVVLFNLIILASCAFAQFPDYAWANVQGCYYWLIVYFLVLNIVNTESRLLLFLTVYLLACAKVSFTLAKVWAMRGFAFTSWGLQGPPGFMANSGELAIQMLMYGPLAMFLALFLRPYISKWKFRFMILMPITAAMVVLGASSRGAQLALGYQLYPTLLKGRITLRNLLLICLAGWALFAALPDAQKARFTSAGDDHTSQQRLKYWTRGVEIIKAYPVLGIGYRNFPVYFEKHYPEDMMYAHAQLPHNIFIEVGTDAGLVGLGCFLALIFRTGVLARRVTRLAQHPEMARHFLIPITRGLMAALWGFLIAGQFVTVSYYPYFWINLAMMASLANVAAKLAAEKGLPQK